MQSMEAPAGNSRGSKAGSILVSTASSGTPFQAGTIPNKSLRSHPWGVRCALKITEKRKIRKS